MPPSRDRHALGRDGLSPRHVSRAGAEMSDRETVHGLHAVQSILEHAPGRVDALWFAAGRSDRKLLPLLELARRHGSAVREAARAELDRRAGNGTHQGIVAELLPAAALGEEQLFSDVLARVAGPALLVLLDGVTDPHNLGACLRSAAAFGADAVIVPRDNAAPLNATVRKAASGAAERVPLIRVANLARCMRRLQESGVWLIGADAGAEQELKALDMRGPIGLVMGAEGGGLRRLTREHCDYLARIPMQGGLESLNVSVATGIFLYEASRRRAPGL